MARLCSEPPRTMRTYWLVVCVIVAHNVRNSLGSQVGSQMSRPKGSEAERRLQHNELMDYYYSFARKHYGGEYKLTVNATSSNETTATDYKMSTASSKGAKIIKRSSGSIKGKKSTKLSKKGDKKSKKNGGDLGSCSSATALAIESSAKDAVVTLNPSNCCKDDGPVAVYVTNARTCGSSIDCDTRTGLEPFWDLMYNEIANNSPNVCFVFTGVRTAQESLTSDVLVNVTNVASQLPNVASMMVTDPTRGTALINLVRSIFDDDNLPPIGVFNSGFDNIVLESIVSGNDTLPYIGLLDDSDYGEVAGSATLDILDGVPGIPLCFQSQTDSAGRLGNRCTSYYDRIAPLAQIEPATGVPCNQNSTEEIIDLLNGINAVWADVGCCDRVMNAVKEIRQMDRIVVFGCQDIFEPDSAIDFVTMQPVELQAYSASSWANLPVLQDAKGRMGKQFFPSLQSRINTEVFVIPVL